MCMNVLIVCFKKFLVALCAALQACAHMRVIMFMHAYIQAY